MKALNVFNSLDFAITVVTNFDNDTMIHPRSFAKIETDARFNSDEFYVSGEQNWQAKFNTPNGADLEIYIAEPTWTDESYKLNGTRMVCNKIGCIRNQFKENQLTVGKIYTVKERLSSSYAVIDNQGGYSSFPKGWFLEFDDEIQADLFELYNKAIDEAKEAEERKSDLFQKLLETGLNRGQILYKSGRLRGIK